MIRVAFDCSNFRKGEAGGYEGFLLNLLDGLLEVDPDDIEVTLFILASQRAHFERYVPRFAIRTHRAPGTVGRIVWQNLFLPFHSAGFDVVVCTANTRPRWMSARTITVVHDLQYVFYPEYFTRSLLWYRLLWVPMSIRVSDRVATISETVKEEIRREYGREDVAVCHQAIAIDALPGCDPLPDIPEPFFLVPSILSVHKNIENLVLALRQCSDEKALPYVVFIGAYPAEDFPYEIPADRGRVLGYVDQGLRDQLLARCAAVILPTLYEGFGMPYAEALLVGRPVIACDIPIAREVLGEEATFIEPGFGPDEIAAAIRRFLAEGQRSPRQEAVERLVARTKPTHVAQRYVDLIRGLVES